jgi:class 3 adenylate cyclase
MPGEVRKTVTVVFTDLVDSTALGERLDPESLRGVMSRYFDEMSAVVGRHGGMIEKFIGDAIMAVFGIPRLHEDDALRASRAAAEMHERLRSLNEELERQLGVRLAIRSAVNTGRVVTGDPDEGQRLVTGDAVNVAARLEQAAAAGEILLGEETARLVHGTVRLEPVEPLALKGKARPVAAYRLVGVLGDVPALTRPFDAPFVGRQRDLRALQRSFDHAVEERSCQLCTIVGPAGIGKSRLARELILTVQQDARVLIGRCLPYGDGITYWPLVEMTKQLPVSVRQTVGEVEDGEMIAARVESVSGMSDAPVAAEEISWAFRRLFEALARERPLIVVVDDIHWAESTLLDLLEYVGRFSSGSPMLLLCGARPELFETRPSWSNPRANSSVIVLEPLAEQETVLLVERLIGGRDVATAMRARVIEAAEGNPLFVEQLLAFQADRESKGVRGELDVPPTLQALLDARVDRLEPHERAVVECGAVEGRLFHRGVVMELAPEHARATVGAYLLTLVRKDFIRPDRTEFPGDDGFRFAHILIRDAVYDAMPKALRAGLHERYAAWLERKVGQDAPQYDEILGYHLEQAYRYKLELGSADAAALRLARAAGERLATAGRRASRRGDTPAAAGLLKRACDLLPPRDELRLTLLVELGAVLVEEGDLAGADRVLAEAESAGEPVALLAAVERRMLASETTDEVDIERDRDLVDRVIPIFEARGEERGLARAWLFRGEIANFLANRSDMGAAAARSAEYARRLGDHRAEAEALRLFAGALVYGPVPAQDGIARIQGLLDAGVPNRMVEAGLVAPLSALTAMRGDFERAREFVARSRRIYADLGLAYQLARLGFMSSKVERCAGELDAAERELRQGTSALREMGMRGRFAGMALELANILCDQGKFEDAAIFLRAVAEAQTASSGEEDFIVRSIRGRLLAHRGDPDGEAMARQAVEDARATDDLLWRIDVTKNFADVLLLGGKSDEAVAALEEVLALCHAKGNEAEAGQTRAGLEGMHADVS